MCVSNLLFQQRIHNTEGSYKPLRLSIMGSLKVWLVITWFISCGYQGFSSDFSKGHMLVTITCPPDTTVQCDQSTDPLNLGFATYTGPLSIISYTDDVIPGGFYPVVETIVRKWKATEVTGAMDSCEQIITIIDDQAPVFQNCPGDQDLVLNQIGRCDTTAYWVAPGISDNCALSNVMKVSGPDPDSAPGAGDGTPMEPGTHTVVYEATDTRGNMATCSFDIHVGATKNLLCKDVNVSLDENCGVKMIPEMVVSGEYPCLEALNVTVFDHGVSLGDSVGFEYLGHNLQFVVSDSSTGNSCWGSMLVEDKYAPEFVVCEDDTVSCIEFEFNALNDPVAVDHCQSVRVILVDQLTETFNCSNFLKLVTRKFVAEDESGNVSDTCRQQVWVERFPLFSRQVYLRGTDTVIYCGSGFELGPTGYIDPAYVTVPHYRRYPLYPLPDFYCNIAIDYDDNLIYNIGCEKRFLRTWKIREWWCNGEQDRLLQQLITIVDTVGPEISGLPDSLYGKAGQRACSADVLMPAASVEDVCHAIERVDMVFPGGFKGNQNGGIIHLPIGINHVVYRVFDECYNMSTDTVIVMVTDRVAPIAVCEQNTVVALDDDGLVSIDAITFDDGSHDECGILKYEVRRMADSCGTGTDVWGPSVDFCCKDVGEDVMVLFRVVDSSFNEGICMVRVDVQDKQPPHIIDLPDIRVNCRFDFDPAHTDVFGKYVMADSLRDSIIIDADFVVYLGHPLDGVVYDNCPPVITEELDSSHIDNCGLGYLLRNFTFTDPHGNQAFRTQTIYFYNPTPFDSTHIIWPEHIDTSNVCGVDSFRPEFLPEHYAFPRFIGEDECSLVGFDYHDEVIDASQGNEACFKIIRTWDVIDWCQKVRGVHRKWSYVQVIEVLNTMAPVIQTDCRDTVYCVYETDCDQVFFPLVASATDDCTDSLDLYWTYKVDLGNDGDFEIVRNGNDASGLYDIDTHRIKFIVEDLCGNLDSCEYVFEIRNCKAPTAYCMNGLIAALSPVDTSTPPDGVFDDEIVEVKAWDFDAGSGHPCDHPIAMSFSADVNDTVRVYNCDSLNPPTRNVLIWVTDLITGETSRCATFVSVQDTNGISVCTGNLTGHVSGQIRMQDSREIENVRMDLVNGGVAPITTDKKGHYAFGNMPFGGIYDIVPGKDGDDLNGVSTADLVAMQRHLLGKAPFTSPYQYLAADINNSQNITAADISELRKLILGVDTDLVKNTSWRFVDADYRFPEVHNPWKEVFPEKYRLEPFERDMTIDFIGVKVGDINGDVTTSGSGPDNSKRESMQLSVKDQRYSYGDVIRVPVNLDQVEQIEGLQFTLEWNELTLRFIDIIPNSGFDVAENNFGLHMVEEGILTCSWHTTQKWFVPSAMEANLFTLEFEVLTDGVISADMHVSSLVTNREVYLKDGSVMEVGLHFEQTVEEKPFALYQNKPNPWSSRSLIKVYAPETASGTIQYFDESGRLIFSESIELDKGYNNVELDRRKIGRSGVYFYKLQTDKYFATRRMVVID